MKPFRRLVWLLLISFWFAPALSMAAAPLDPGSVLIPKMTPKLNLGKMLYDGKCASCHGKNAAGTDKGPTFLNRVYHPGHHGDAAFYAAPTRGVKAHHWRFGDMPRIEEITERQIENIILYVRMMQKTNGIF